MRNKNFTLFATVLALFAMAPTASIAALIGDDSLTLGKKGSAADKTVKMGSGRIVWSQGTSRLKFSNDGGSSFKNLGSGGGGAAGINLLQDANFDFEGGTAGWTASGGSFSIATAGSNHLFDVNSGVFNSSATGQTLSSVSQVIPDGLKGAPGVAYCYFKTTATDYKLQVFDGTSVVAQTVIPAILRAPSKIVAPFLFPASGSLALRISSQSDAADLAMDNCYLGEAQVAPVSQASFAGGITTTGCTLDALAVGGSFTDMAASGCVSGTGLLGSASAFANTGNGSVTFNNLPPGEYEAIWSGTCDATGMASGTNYQFRLTDGTTSGMAAKILAVHSAGNATEQSVPCVLRDRVTYSVAGSHTFKMQATGDGSASLHFYMDSTANSSPFSLYRYPTMADTLSYAGTQAATWSGYFSGGTAWSTTSTSKADFGGGTSMALTQRSNVNFGSVSQDGALPGIVFTPVAGHQYEIEVDTNITGTVVGSSSTLYLTDNGTPLAINNMTTTVASGEPAPISIRAFYTAPSSSAAHIRLQGKTINSGSTTFVGSDDGAGVGEMDWYVKDITQPAPTPVLVGQVSSSSAGQLRLEVAGITSGVQCASSPCAFDFSTPGMGPSMLRASAGTYSLVFATPWAVKPICTLSGNAQMVLDAVTTTNVDFRTFPAASSSAGDWGYISIQCVGPK